MLPLAMTAPLSPSALPGLSPLPLLGGKASLVRFLTNPLRLLLEAHREHGRLAALARGDPSLVCAFGAEYNQPLLSNAREFHNFAELPFPLPAGSAAARLAQNLTAMNGEQHRRHRRLMMPAFQRLAVEGYWGDMVAVAERHLARWPRQGELDMAAEMVELSLAVMMRCLFGLEVGSREAVELGDLSVGFLRGVTSPAILLFPFQVPGSPFSRFLALCERLAERLQAMVNERRASPAQRRDALSLLIQAHDEDGSVLTNDELMGQASLLFIAGHETAAFALAWTLFLLSQHPRVHADLVDELAGRLRGEAPTVAQLEELPLLDAVVKESLRLLPPTPFLFLRQGRAPFRLGPYELPAGSRVILSPLITHRLEEVFPAPWRFRPERWQGLRPSPFEYLPFGAGPRMCVGAAFASLELRVVLALVLQRHRLTLPPGARVDCKTQGITAGPHHGVRMRVAPQDRHFPPPGPVRGNIHALVRLEA